MMNPGRKKLKEKFNAQNYTKLHYIALCKNMVDKVGLDTAEGPDRHRNLVVNELVQTEIAYIHDLQVLIGLYMKPLQLDFPGIIEAYEINSIFKNIEVLYNNSFEFLRNLCEECKKKPSEQGIGATFIRMIKDTDDLRSLNIYCCNQIAADQTITQLFKTNDDFKLFCEMVAALQESNRLGLQNYLIKPFQRLCRYSLFLKELMKHTPGNWSDLVNVQLAYDSIEKIVKAANESKRTADNLITMVTLQQTLVLPDEEKGFLASIHHLQSGFVDRGEFIEIDPEGKDFKVQLFLFKSFCLLASPKGKKLVKNDLIPAFKLSCRKLEVLELPPNKLQIPQVAIFPFQLSHQDPRKHNHFLICEDEMQQEKWMKLFQETAAVAPPIQISDLLSNNAALETQTRKLSIQMRSNSTMKLVHQITAPFGKDKKQPDVKLIFEQKILALQKELANLMKLQPSNEAEKVAIIEKIEECEATILALNGSLKDLKGERQLSALSICSTLTKSLKIPKDIIEGFRDDARIEEEEEQKPELKKNRSNTFQDALHQKIVFRWISNIQALKTDIANCDPSDIEKLTVLQKKLEDAERTLQSLRGPQKKTVIVFSDGPTQHISDEEECHEDEHVAKEASDDFEEEEPRNSVVDFKGLSIKDILEHRIKEKIIQLTQLNSSLNMTDDEETRVIITVEIEETRTLITALQLSLDALLTDEQKSKWRSSGKPIGHNEKVPIIKLGAHTKEDGGDIALPVSPRSEKQPLLTEMKKEEREATGSKPILPPKPKQTPPPIPPKPVFSQNHSNPPSPKIAKPHDRSSVENSSRRIHAATPLPAIPIKPVINREFHEQSLPKGEENASPISSNPLSPRSSLNQTAGSAIARSLLLPETKFSGYKEELMKLVSEGETAVLSLSKSISTCKNLEERTILENRLQAEGERLSQLTNRLRLLDQEEAVRTVERQIEGIKDINLVMPERRLLLQAKFTKKAKRVQTRQFFLFSDLLLYAAIKGSRKFVYKGHIMNDQIVSQDLPDMGDIKNAISIFRLDEKKQYIIYTDDVSIKNEWIFQLKLLQIKNKKN